MAQLMSIKKNVDVQPGVGVPAIFHCSQGDKGTRIILGLLNNNDTYTIPEGTTAIIRGSRADGTLFTEITADIDTTTEIKFNLTEDMTSVAGPVECEAVMTSGTANVIGTANFIIDVERSPASIGSVFPGTDAATTWLIDKLENEPLNSLNGESVVDAINDSSGSGLTEDVKVALLACFEKVAWIDEDGQDYYDALYDALYPSTNLVSISAVFNQGQNVIYVTDSLDTLKQYLTVTAYYSDSTTETISTYVLSGTLTEGTSTITVSYGGKTTTFSVNVTRYVIYDYLYTSRTSGSGTNDYVSTDLVHTPSFNTLNVEFEAMNLNDGSQADPLFCANNTDTSNTGNMVWYSRVDKGGFSAYNLGVAKQLNTVPGDTRATIKYFFVDGGESYMQYENTIVAVATMAKSAVAQNNKTLMLAGGYSFTNGEKYGMRVGGKTKLGYIKFTDPDSGDILYHFKPAHDLSTGKYGFLETINNHFYPDYDTYLRCGNWEE